MEEAKLILVQTHFQLGACKSTSKDKTEANPVLEADKTRTLNKHAPISHEAQTNNNKRTVSVHFKWKWYFRTCCWHTIFYTLKFDLQDNHFSQFNFSYHIKGERILYV